MVFGTYFVFALASGLYAIRRRDPTNHRRWMIRAFSVALAVATIRVWLGLFVVLGLLPFRESFGVAFWIAFVIHALVTEGYLALHRQPGRRHSAGAPSRTRTRDNRRPTA